MRANLRTSQNFELSPEDIESPTGISQTVPDQSMTVNELLDRHQRGLPIKAYDPVYYDDDVPNIHAMDLVDIAEMREELSERSAYLRKKLKDEKSIPLDNLHPTHPETSGEIPPPNQPTAD